MTTITTDDIESVLGRVLTDDELSRSVRLIDFAEAAIEDSLPGFSIGTGTETVDVLPDDPDTLWTPRYPVTAVTELAFDHITVDAAFYDFTVKGRIDLGFWAIPVINWPTIWRSRKVTITYDFGLDPAPVGIVKEGAEMIAAHLRRAAGNPNGSMSYTIGSVSESFGAGEQAALAAGMGLPSPSVLRRWSRTRTVSVPLTRTR